MSLFELAKTPYRGASEGHLVLGVPVGFGVMRRGVFVLFGKGNYRWIDADTSRVEDGPLLRPSILSDRRCHASAGQVVDEDTIAVLFSSVGEPDFIVVARYSGDGQLADMVEFPWSGWDPSSRTFLYTNKGTFVFPHNRQFTREKGWFSTPESPLLDLYDGNGQLLRSFGTAQPHADMNMVGICNRGHLIPCPGGEILFAFVHPYRLLKFDVDGDLQWDKSFEVSFPVHPPSMGSLEGVFLEKDLFEMEREFERVARTGNPQAMMQVAATHGIRYTKVVKDIGAGANRIIVLAARDESELNHRFGSRIDVLTLDGEHVGSFDLPRPATFIAIDDANDVWALHEHEGLVAGYRIVEAA